MNESGKLSTDARNETQLVCDILGLESLVDAITFAPQTTSSSNLATSSAILGPFWRPNAPILPMGSSIVSSLPASCGPDADHTYLHGRVLSASTGQPVEGAELDIWHTAPNGLYEQQDEEQEEMNLRGRFVTGKDGRYALYCLRPTSYPIPDDGPGGKLLKLLDRHPMRPAHIHFIVSNHLILDTITSPCGLHSLLLCRLQLLNIGLLSPRFSIVATSTSPMILSLRSRNP
jgi:catechol 1,2-dioxygenase